MDIICINENMIAINEMQRRNATAAKASTDEDDVNTLGYYKHALFTHTTIVVVCVGAMRMRTLTTVEHYDLMMRSKCSTLVDRKDGSVLNI